MIAHFVGGLMNGKTQDFGKTFPPSSVEIGKEIYRRAETSKGRLVYIWYVTEQI